MAKYLVKSGYCLHLPHGRFAQPGEEVELAGDLEQEVLKNQGWKVAPVARPPKAPAGSEAREPEVKEVAAPPQDRAVKEARTK
jgi:hypothetical protein